MSLFAPDEAALKLVRAPLADVAPVPPFANAIVVPVHVPLVMVPTVLISVPINFDAGIDPAKSLANTVFAVANFPAAFPLIKSVVNFPLDAVVAPIGVPLILPPLITTLLLFCVEILPRFKLLDNPAKLVSPVPPLATLKVPVKSDTGIVLEVVNALVPFPLT